MSASAALAIGARPQPLDRDARPGLGRLTRVELRKMVDTRSGFWLLFAVLALTVLAVIISCATGEASGHVFREVLGNAIGPSAVLLPVVGILLVSSEWSQRTNLVTFTLVPARSRVIAAKLLAAIALSLLALAICLALSAAGTAIASPGVAHTWSLPAGLLGQDAVVIATSMIGGIAFGAALLSSPPAIVLYFALPIAWSALGSLSFMHGLDRWLDTSKTLNPLPNEMFDATQWAHAVATLALWMALPLAIGLWRIRRNEVR